jgi:hypothetical protein
LNPKSRNRCVSTAEEETSSINTGGTIFHFLIFDLSDVG